MLPKDRTRRYCNIAQLPSFRFKSSRFFLVTTACPPDLLVRVLEDVARRLAVLGHRVLAKVDARHQLANDDHVDAESETNVSKGA